MQRVCGDWDGVAVIDRRGQGSEDRVEVHVCRAKAAPPIFLLPIDAACDGFKAATDCLHRRKGERLPAAGVRERAA